MLCFSHVTAFSCSIIIAAAVGIVGYGELFKNLPEGISFIPFVISATLILASAVLFQSTGKKIDANLGASRENIELKLCQSGSIST